MWEGVAGIRPATLLLAAPNWATVALDSLSQDPAVCNARGGLPTPRAGYGTWRVVKDALLIASGWLAGKL